MKHKKLLAGILVFGSLWGFSECIIGSLLHDAGLPAGAIMTAVFAIGLLTISRVWYQQRGIALGMGLVAGALRLFNPFGGCYLCSAIAIMAEGAIFELIWYRLSLDLKELQTLTYQSSIGIISAYVVYVGGYIITQIFTPILSSAGFHLENLLVFLPNMFASGLLAALVGAATVPVLFSVKKLDITIKDRLYYPITIGISIVCWTVVIINTAILLWL